MRFTTAVCQRSWYDSACWSMKVLTACSVSQTGEQAKRTFMRSSRLPTTKTVTA